MSSLSAALVRCKDGLVLLLTPLLLSPLLIWHYQSTELRCLFVVLLMAVYWALAPIPLPVTALIPVVAFPLLGLASTEKACEPYLAATNMLFLASLVVAIAMESSGFHKRIALRALLLLGDNIRTLFAGFMVTTAFLGIWIINTAATAMILPIADVVIQEVMPLPTSTTSTTSTTSPSISAKLNEEEGQQLKDNEDDHAQLEPNCEDLSATVVTGMTTTINHNRQPRMSSVNFDSRKVSLSPEEHLELLAQQQLTSSSRSDGSASSPQLKSKFKSCSRLTGRLHYIRRLLYIVIAFAATIGGTTTLTSNGPNLVFQFVLDDLFNGQANVDYAKWLLFCLPATALSVLLCWALMTRIYLRADIIASIRRSPKSILQKKYDELGPVSFHELSVCLLFVVLICLWMFRDPQFMNGWVTLLGEDGRKTKDTTPAILVVILLFCIPRQPLGPFPSLALLDWTSVQSKLAWGVILLRGGGFSMANVATSSGLTKLIGSKLGVLHQLPVPLVVAAISFLASFTTELASNSAIATIFLPLSSEIALALGQHPLLFLVPVTLSCSYAFMLPVGTPANALVSSHASLRPADMALPGLLTKLLCLLVMLLNLYVLGVPMFALNEGVPQWALPPAAALTSPSVQFSNSSSVGQANSTFFTATSTAQTLET